MVVDVVAHAMAQLLVGDSLAIWLNWRFRQAMGEGSNTEPHRLAFYEALEQVTRRVLVLP